LENEEMAVKMYYL